MKTVTDDDYMRLALELARRGEGHTRPNPPVGAVIVRKGKVIGRGWHRRCGGDHAEVAAIKNCRETTRGATIYVTLEPCSKPGRVGACTDAIAAAGITQVVYAEVDPNPKNRGRAARVLKKHGIDCVRWRSQSPDLAAELHDLIAPFRKHVTEGLPYVTVKLAMSLDGRICDRRGDAKWISSSAARQATGKYRERVDAILVGAETVRRDNPSLLSHGRRNDDLVRVIVTHSGDLPENAQVFTDGRNETWVFQLCAAGDADNAAELREVLRALAERGVMHVLCEGGLKLATALAEAGLVDEWLTVLSPCVIGTRPMSEKLTAEWKSSTVTSAGDCLCGFRLPKKTK